MQTIATGNRQPNLITNQILMIMEVSTTARKAVALLLTATIAVGASTQIVEVAEAGEVDAVEVARYDVHGRRLAKPVPGINIVRMSDGTTHKQFQRE